MDDRIPLSTRIRPFSQSPRNSRECSPRVVTFKETDPQCFGRRGGMDVFQSEQSKVLLPQCTRGEILGPGAPGRRGTNTCRAFSPHYTAHPAPDAV